eukprot:51989-Eustigmatos_ZCMA.PRE.1
MPTYPNKTTGVWGTRLRPAKSLPGITNSREPCGAVLDGAATSRKSLTVASVYADRRLYWD